MPPPVTKVALRVPTSQLAFDTGPTTYDDLNDMGTHWIVLNTTNGKVEFVPGDQDPFTGTPL